MDGTKCAPLIKYLWIVLHFLFIVNSMSAQNTWDWRDPNDFGSIDLGDNKVLLYNAIGLGLACLLSKSHITDTDKRFQSLTVEVNHEYIRPPLSNMLFLKYRRGRNWRKCIWLGLESIATFNVNVEKVAGIGISPFFSWNIINRSSFRLSYDNGVGPVLFSGQFPDRGTQFNFYTYYGLQIEVIKSDLSYALGFRNNHISNADIKGSDRNPAYDGLGAYFTIRF